MTIGSWLYLWAFYSVLLIYISVFVPAPYWLDECSFVVWSEAREHDSSSCISSALLSQEEQVQRSWGWGKPDTFVGKGKEVGTTRMEQKRGRVIGGDEDQATGPCGTQKGPWLLL